MNEPASRDGGKQKLTKPKCCQAKGCPKLGTPRSIVDNFGNCRWGYFMCDEHVRVLTQRDQIYIARTEGTMLA